MRRALMRIVWAIVSAIAWCFTALRRLGWFLLPIVLAVIVVLVWAGVAITRGRNWAAWLLAIGVTASFVPVIRREWSIERAARAERSAAR